MLDKDETLLLIQQANNGNDSAKTKLIEEINQKYCQKVHKQRHRI